MANIIPNRDPNRSECPPFIKPVLYDAHGNSPNEAAMQGPLTFLTVQIHQEKTVRKKGLSRRCAINP
jgi:hypothetical protein